MAVAELSNSHSLRELLKVETLSAHKELERSLAIMSPRLTVFRYKTILETFLSIYRPFEKQVVGLAKKSCKASVFYLNGRTKTQLLISDLMIDDFERPENWDANKGHHHCSTPLSDASFAWLQTTAQVWGAMYVIEGSTLGGQVISKHLNNLPSLAQNPWGTRFFRGYEERTGAQWRSFLTALDQVSTEDHAQVLHGAAKMFGTFLEQFKPSSDQSEAKVQS